MDTFRFYARAKPFQRVSDFEEGEDPSMDVADSSSSKYISSDADTDSLNEADIHSNDACNLYLSDEEGVNSNTCEEDACEQQSVSTDWLSVSKKQRHYSFGRKEELCIRVTPTSTENKVWPIDVYRQIVTDEVINPIVEETNRFAAQTIASVMMTSRSKLQQWTPTKKRRNGEVHWAPNLHGTCTPR